MKRALILIPVLVAAALIYMVRGGDDGSGRSIAQSGLAPRVVETEQHDPRPIVVDPSGVPLAGVFVRTLVAAGEPVESFSDNDGRIGVAPADARRLLRHEGFARREVVGADLRIVMRPGQTIRGHVVDRSGKGLADCRVRARIACMRAPWNEDFATTDLAGAFVLRDLPAGEVELKVIEGALQIEPVVVAAGRIDVRIVVTRKVTVYGRVVDERGRPAAGGEIHSEDETWNRRGDLTGGTWYFEADGRFKLEIVPRGSIRIFAVDRENSRSAPLSLSLERATVHLANPLVVSRARSVQSYVHVRVQDENGDPVDSASVRVSRRAWLPAGTRRNSWGTAALPPLPELLAGQLFPGGFIADLTPRTDDAGLCSFSVSLPPGEQLEVFVEPTGWYRRSLLLPTRAILRTRSDLESSPTTISCRRGVVRRVRLLDDEEQSLNFALIVAGPHQGTSSLGRKFNRYVLDPESTYRILAYGSEFVDEIEANWKPPLEDVATTFRSADAFRLETYSDQKLATEFRDSSGALVPRVRFDFVSRRTPFSDSESLSFITDASGSLRLDVSPGPAQFLMIEKTGFARAVFADVPETITMQTAAALQIVLRPPGRWRLDDWRLDIRANGLQLTLPYCFRKQTVNTFEIAKASQPSHTERRYHWGAGETLSPGATGILRDLPPGLCEVRLWTDGYELKRSVRLVAGVTRTLVLEPR